MPYVNHAYLIQGSILQDPENYPSFINGLLDPDMAFCKNLRDKVRHLILTCIFISLFVCATGKKTFKNDFQ